MVRRLSALRPRPGLTRRFRPTKSDVSPKPRNSWSIDSSYLLHLESHPALLHAKCRSEASQSRRHVATMRRTCSLPVRSVSFRGRTRRPPTPRGQIAFENNEQLTLGFHSYFGSLYFPSWMTSYLGHSIYKNNV